MVVVNKKKGETKDSLFRRFSKMFLEENIMENIKDRMFYKKPSILKKEHKKMRRHKR